MKGHKCNEQKRNEYVLIDWSLVLWQCHKKWFRRSTFQFHWAALSLVLLKCVLSSFVIMFCALLTLPMHIEFLFPFLFVVVVVLSVHRNRLHSVHHQLFWESMGRTALISNTLRFEDLRCRRTVKTRWSNGSGCGSMSDKVCTPSTVSSVDWLCPERVSAASF